MATRERVQIDGKDLHEFGITVIRYEDGLLAAPKDGGGLDLEGIDGVVPTNSTIMTNLTGKLEVSIEGSTELDVLDTLRSFKQFIRDGDYRQFSVDNNLGYYRLGKIITISESKMYELIEQKTAIGFFIFDIIYMNGYEYSINSIDLIFNEGSTIASPVFTFTNSGAPNREAVLTISAIDEPLTGRVAVTCYSENQDKSVTYINQLVIGKEGKVLADSMSSVRVDFGEPSIDLIGIIDGSVTPKMSLYNSGQFFTVPRGKIRLTVEQLNEAGIPQAHLDANVRLIFTPKFN